MHALPVWLQSLRARVVLLLLLVSLPAVLFGVIYAIHARDREQADALTRLNRLALAATAYQGEVLFGTETLLAGLSVTPEVWALARRPVTADRIPECGAPVPQMWEAFPQFLDLRVINREGAVVCTSQPYPKTVSEADRAWFSRALTDRRFSVGEFEISPVTGLPAVVAATPLVDDESNILGVLAAEIGLDWIDRAAPKMEVPEGGSIFLLDLNGKAITRFPKDIDISGVAFPPEAPLLAALASQEDPAPFVAEGRDGVQRAFGLASLRDIGISVLASVPTSEAFAPAEREFWSVIGRIAVVWVLTLAAAWFVTENLITRPVRSVIRSASAIRRGDLSARPAIPRTDSELRQLSVMFSEMADRIVEREETLRTAIKEREVLLREVHHRVKNNLQIITSLLNMQLSDKRSQAVAGQLLDAKTRIRALSIVHDQLYRKADLSSVDLHRLCEDLCKQFWQIHGIEAARIGHTVAVPSISIDMEKAIPISLFIAEALTNALKHAFPGGRPGSVQITAERTAEGMRLSIRDDGVGFEQMTEASPSYTSLGMRLMQGLADQLDADLDISGRNGTNVQLSFRTETLNAQRAEAPGKSQLAG
jgi:two-component sensor histidine kinase